MKTKLLTLGIVFLMTGCGGGSSSSSGTSQTPMPVQGIYFGLLQVNGQRWPVSVYGAIRSGGYAYFVDELGTLYVLPTIVDTGAVNGTMTAYASPGQVFPDGKSIDTFQITAKVSSDGVFLNGSFSGSGQSGTLQLNYEPLTISNVTVNAGTYTGFYWGDGGNVAIALTVNPDNTFSGTDGFGCSFTGTIKPLTGFNLFTVTADSTGQPVCAGKVSGLGFAGTGDLTGQFGGTHGVYFYIGASNTKDGIAAEFKFQ